MHMTAEAKKFNILGIVGIIGAILMIVGVFLSWMDLSVSFFGYSETYSATGMDVFSGKLVIADGIEFGFDTITAYSYAPVVALVCGVLALIATIVPTVFNKGKVGKILGAVALILAIVSIVISFMFYGDVSAFEGSVDLVGIVGATVSVGMGFWLAIAGAIITIIGGILDVAKKGA